METHPLTQSESEALSTEAEQIAAMAKSLRASLGRFGSTAPLTRHEARDIVELVELLAETVMWLERHCNSKRGGEG